MNLIDLGFDGGPWIVAETGTLPQHCLIEALRSRGHRVRSTGAPPRKTLDPDGPPTAVLANLDDADPLATAAAVHRLRLAHPMSRPIVLIDRADVVSASAVMRAGGQPVPGCTPGTLTACGGHSASEIDRMCSWVDPPPEDRWSAVGALVAAVEGNLIEAVADLAHLDDGLASLLAADELILGAAALVNKIERRTRYSIPVRLVVENLAPGAEVDTAGCLDVMRWAAVHTGCIDFDLEELVARHSLRGVLFGAFHSTLGLIRFASRRWWRPERSVLDEVFGAAGPDGACTH